jgi:hypothetical protein
VKRGGNPFSTERVRPGALPFFGDDERSLDAVEKSFIRHGLRGQIVGPHGVGKSTLLKNLVERLQGASTRVSLAPSAPHDGSLWVVDAVDKLNVHGRARLEWRRWRGPILVATHTRWRGLPVLWEARPEPACACRIVTHLLDGWSCEPPTETYIGARLDAVGGNVRELLFELYDWYEDVGSGAS